MGKRLINLENGEPLQYIEGETFYSTEFYELVEGELTDDMINEFIIEENNINKIKENNF